MKEITILASVIASIKAADWFEYQVCKVTKEE